MNHRQAKIEATKVAAWHLRHSRDSIIRARPELPGLKDGDRKLFLREYNQIITDLENTARLWEASDE